MGGLTDLFLLFRISLIIAAWKEDGDTTPAVLDLCGLKPVVLREILAYIRHCVRFKRFCRHRSVGGSNCHRHSLGKHSHHHRPQSQNPVLAQNPMEATGDHRPHHHHSCHRRHYRFFKFNFGPSVRKRWFLFTVRRVPLLIVSR